jgi:hypothetical protein
MSLDEIPGGHVKQEDGTELKPWGPSREFIACKSMIHALDGPMVGQWISLYLSVRCPSFV